MSLIRLLKLLKKFKYKLKLNIVFINNILGNST